GEEFECDSYRCIPLIFLCDDMYQCLDKTDEGPTGCSSEQEFCKTVMEIRPYFGYIVAIVVLSLLILAVGTVGICWCLKLQNTFFDVDCGFS
ncbi:hypothetical protein GH825_30000, partial [Bacillus thuringiensis]|nr:hypothetical protein [Bacillus thuringiensis]